jgi:hypothetical protein
MTRETTIKIFKSKESFSISIDDELRVLGNFDERGCPVNFAKNELDGKIDDETIYTLLDLP